MAKADLKTGAWLPADVRFGIGVLLERIGTEAMSDYLNCDIATDEAARKAVRTANAAAAWMASVAGIVAVKRCRVCGCTDECGCDQGCWWVEEDLCSCCVPCGIAAAVKQAHGQRRTAARGTKKGKKP